MIWDLGVRTMYCYWKREGEGEEGGLSIVYSSSCCTCGGGDLALLALYSGGAVFKYAAGCYRTTAPTQLLCSTLYVPFILQWGGSVSVGRTVESAVPHQDSGSPGPTSNLKAVDCGLRSALLGLWDAVYGLLPQADKRQ